MKIVLIVLASLVVLATTAMAVFVFVIQNVETPNYEVVRTDSAFEIRQYPALIVAEVTRTGDRKAALSAGFSPLAGYIFAKERAGDRVAMTAPVVQQSDEQIAMTVPVTQAETDSGEWRVRFIMPAAYTVQTLPQPGDADVQLREVPPQRIAAVRFSGRATDELIAEQERALRAWMDEQNLSAINAPTYAYYNDPFTPGFLRRNEVLIEIAAD